MSLSKIALINRSCAIIGADPLDTLDEDTPGAQIVSLRYDSLLEFCVGLEDWSFATATRRLAQRSGITILNGWQYCYALPADRIGQPIKVSPTANWPRTFFTDWLVEGNDVFANEAELYAQIRTTPDPSAMSATFRRAFETGMAGEFAMGLASDKILRAQLLRDAFGTPEMNGCGGMMGAAIQQNRKENPSKGIGSGSGPLIAAHLGAGPYAGVSFP